MQNFSILASLCSWADWFEHYLVRNTKDRFSCVEAHNKVGIVLCTFQGITGLKFSNCFVFLINTVCRLFLPQQTVQTLMRSFNLWHLPSNIIHAFLSSANFFKINFFSKNSFRNTIRVSNILDPGQARILSGLIWIQTVCKDYQQTPLGGRLNTKFQSYTSRNIFSGLIIPLFCEKHYFHIVYQTKKKGRQRVLLSDGVAWL